MKTKLANSVVAAALGKPRKAWMNSGTSGSSLSQNTPNPFASSMGKVRWPKRICEFLINLKTHLGRELKVFKIVSCRKCPETASESPQKTVDYYG